MWKLEICQGRINNEMRYELRHLWKEAKYRCTRIIKKTWWKWNCKCQTLFSESNASEAPVPSYCWETGFRSNCNQTPTWLNTEVKAEYFSQDQPSLVWSGSLSWGSGCHQVLWELGDNHSGVGVSTLGKGTERGPFSREGNCRKRVGE